MSIKKRIYFLFLFGISIMYGKIVKYNFDISIKKVNFTGKKITALAINDQIPGPTIEATEGDTLEVTVNNKTKEKTIIHWHGVLLPNDQDGVPYLTTNPILPGSSFTYTYKVSHYGTYWYHSHVGLQEQRGLYGAIIFHPKKGERIKADKDHVVVLSDWTNENPNKVLANLKKDGDYYALKKRSVQSWDKVIKYGIEAFKKRLKRLMFNMKAMDISDIGYDHFLSNGKKEEYIKASVGDKVRIRLINAAASTYFNVEYAGSTMKVVAADGVDVEPFQVNRLRIAIAETYDVIILINEQKAYELRATAEDGTGYSSTFIGSGKKILAPDIPKPNLFLMNHNNKHMKKMKDSSINHQLSMKNNIVDYMKDYENLRAIKKTFFNKNKKIKEINLNLTGSMDGYVWSFNNKVFSQSDKIIIKKGEIVRINLDNQTMMHHPIHLHGHFFRVLNKQDEKSPLKHTINVPSMDKVTIEFDAKEEKDWLFHCHNLYHMQAGMSRIISYKDSTKAIEKTVKKLSDDNRWYVSTDIAVLSNMVTGLLKIFSIKGSFEFDFDHNYKKEYCAELIYARSLTSFFNIYFGGSFERADKNEKVENIGVIGIKCTLPFFIDSDLSLNSKKDLSLEFSSNLQLTERLNFSWSYDTSNAYTFNFNYELRKKYLLAAIYDSDFKGGIGLRCRF